MTVSAKQSGERKNSFAALLFSFGILFLCFFRMCLSALYPECFRMRTRMRKSTFLAMSRCRGGSMYFSTESIGDKPID